MSHSCWANETDDLAVASRSPVLHPSLVWLLSVALPSVAHALRVDGFEHLQQFGQTPTRVLHTTASALDLRFSAHMQFTPSHFKGCAYYGVPHVAQLTSVQTVRLHVLGPHNTSQTYIPGSR